MISKIIQYRNLTESTFVLRFERKGLNFQAGQHILVGRDQNEEMREYSIYSGEQDNFLEILVKEINEGMVSKQLKHLQEGDFIYMEGAVGFFRINVSERDRKFLFIASGTGISPFHSFVKTYKKLDYTILHGVKNINEAYERFDYPDERYISCTSKDSKGDFVGRVTDYLIQNRVSDDTLIYLCGNSNMILDVKDILADQRVPRENIRTEVYF